MLQGGPGGVIAHDIHFREEPGLFSPGNRQPVEDSLFDGHFVFPIIGFQI